jgi:hypothetical protein
LPLALHASGELVSTGIEKELPDILAVKDAQRPGHRRFRRPDPNFSRAVARREAPAVGAECHESHVGLVLGEEPRRRAKVFQAPHVDPPAICIG